MKKIIAICFGIIIVTICIIAGFGISITNTEEEEELWGLIFDNDVTDQMDENFWYIEDGYDDVSEWLDELNSLKEQYASIASTEINEYGDYLTQQDIDRINKLGEEIQDAHSIRQIVNLVFEIEAITNKAVDQQQA